MTYLSAGDMAQMQRVLATTWPDSIVVHRKSDTSDGQGGSIAAYAAHGTYLGRVAYVTARAGEERVSGGRTVAEASWVVTLPGTASVLDTDRIVYEGGTLNVVHVKTPTTWQMTTRVECMSL